MGVYSILIHPDKRLRRRADEVTQFNKALIEIVDTMFETMYAAHGIGLAATQVNIHQRIIVMDVPRISRDRLEEDNVSITTPHDKLVLINPQIQNSSEELAEREEGCLSLPGQYASVKRPARITVTFQDIEGQHHTLDAQDLLATCIQHEIDHINGILFIDHLSRLKRERIESKLAKAQKSS